MEQSNGKQLEAAESDSEFVQVRIEAGMSEK